MIRTPQKRRLAVLRGGVSDEAKLSMQNGAEIIAVLNSFPNIEVLDVTITKTGDWLVYGMQKTPDQALQHVDHVVIALHGIYGEDGTVQRIIERLGVSYSGSTPYASAIGMHKMLAKEYITPLGIKTAPHMQVGNDSSNDWVSISSTIKTLFGPEYIVKPMRGGSSIGMRHIVETDSLATILKEMTEMYGDILVEEYIDGTDVTVGVIEGLRNVDYYVTPVVEIVSDTTFTTDVFAVEKIAPGRVHKNVRDQLLQQAVAIHNELALKDFSRSDWRVTREGDIYFLETNSLPAVTKNSPLMAGLESVGVSQEELVQHLVKV